MVKVFYNGIDAFSGICPTPFVAVSDEMINYGSRWGVTQNISLNGSITGSCSNTFGDLLSKQSGLFSNFAQDFKNLQIYQDNQVIFSGTYAKVNNISFDQSTYAYGLMGFKIDLITFQKDFFSGTFGVIDPVSTIKFTEQKDSTVTITRNFSAKGFNTSTTTNNALDNARNYVQSLTGVSNNLQTVPYFITGINLNLPSFLPRKISENIDRTNSTYAVSIDYLLRKNPDGSCTPVADAILSYAVDASYDDEKGIYSCALNGSLNGAISKPFTDLQSDIKSLDFYNIALYEFSKCTNYNFLYPYPESFSIDENQNDNIISFNYRYNSDPYDTKLSENISINNEYITDKISLNYNATITTRGAQKIRAQKLENALKSLDISSSAQTYFSNNVINPSVPLNPIPKNLNIRKDLINNNSISISASFDNSPTPQINGLKKFNWNISITPSIYKYAPIYFVNGQNGKFNLNYYNRGQITVQGNAIAVDSADYSNAIRSSINGIMDQYLSTVNASNTFLIEDKVERTLQSEDGYSYSFTLTKSCETTIFSI